MMVQDWAESTWVTISYESFINLFPLDTIKSIQQLERTYTKMCRQNVYIVQWNMHIYIYIYVYAYNEETTVE